MVVGVRNQIGSKEVKEFFEKRFRAISMTNITLDDIGFHSLSEEDNRTLTSNIEEEEIKEVVTQCGTFRSPGLMRSILTLLKIIGRQ